MAKEQKPFERSLLTPSQNVTGGNAFDQMGDAAGTLSTILSSKASDIAIEQAGEQGALEASEGKAPNQLMPPLTKATKAYNKAVSDTEAMHMVTSAKEQIQTSLLNYADPKNFTTESPAKFRAEMSGIIEGTLEHARDSNRAQIQASLESIEANASVQMLKQSIQHDNRVINDNFKNDVNALESQLKSDYVSNNPQAIQETEQALNKVLDDYGTRSEAINQALPQIKEQLQESKQVYQVMGDYSKAASDGFGSKFLADFVENKQQLPLNVYQKAAKELLTLQDTGKKLRQEAAAEDSAQVERGIQNGTITSKEQITEFQNQTPLQLINNIGRFERKQAQFLKDNQDILQAQKDISNGQSGIVSGQVKNKMFDTWKANYESQTGQTADLFAMAESLTGKGDFPMSGIPGVAMRTNVPKLDALMESELTSSDPQRTANAGAIYHNVVSSQQQPNAIKLSGKALSTAQVYDEAIQNGTSTPEEAAQTAIQRVMNVSDAERKQRDENFKAITSKELKKWFAEDLGAKVQDFKTDAAFTQYKDNLYSQYVNANSFEAARKATAYKMSNWSESRYFDSGVVTANAPEKQVPEANIAYTFDNQIRVGLQSVINRNRSLRKTDEGFHTIEWDSPNKDIDFNNITDHDKVYTLLGQEPTPQGIGAFASGTGFGAGVVMEPGHVKPRVTVDGVSSDVFLKDDADTNLGKTRTYTLMYYDKFGIPTPIPDPTNHPKGVAQFSVSRIGDWAPSIAENQTDEQVKETARRFVSEQNKQELERQQKNASFLAKHLIPAGGVDPNTLLNYLNGDQEAEKKVETILRQRMKPGKKTKLSEDMSDSEHVGLNTAALNSNAKDSE